MAQQGGVQRNVTQSRLDKKCRKMKGIKREVKRGEREVKGVNKRN